MPYFLIPSNDEENRDISNARFYPNATQGSTITGFSNNTPYRIYSLTEGPTITPSANARPVIVDFTQSETLSYLAVPSMNSGNSLNGASF